MKEFALQNKKLLYTTEKEENTSDGGDAPLIRKIRI
jgi:hypothetical protein